MSVAMIDKYDAVRTCDVCGNQKVVQKEQYNWWVRNGRQPIHCPNCLPNRVGVKGKRYNADNEKIKAGGSGYKLNLKKDSLGKHMTEEELRD